MLDSNRLFNVKLTDNPGAPTGTMIGADEGQVAIFNPKLALF